MTEVEIGAALDFTMDKLSALEERKEQEICLEIRGRQRGAYRLLKNVPSLSRSKRGVIVHKNHKKLMKVLKLRPKEELGYLSSTQGGLLAGMFTGESLAEYSQLWDTLTKHPQYDKVVKFNEGIQSKIGLLKEEESARVAELVHKFSEVKMGLISGSIRLKDFPSVLEELEQKDF